MSKPAFSAAALAGVPAGVQAQGIWMGRRQLFVKFAGEAETATMYTSEALSRDLQRQTQRAAFHSVSVTGRDPLANVDFLLTAFERAQLTIPVMLDLDGQRPNELSALAPFVTLVQVTQDPGAADTMLERAFATIRNAATAGLAHAFVAMASVETTDAQILRTVEGARDASPQTDVIILPPTSGEHVLDRRWSVVLDQAMQLHARSALGARLPAPAGMR
jgi:organic radical activating enzyme